MSQTSILQKLAGAAVTLGAVGSVFAADQTTSWTGSADEVRALVSEIMADADTRSSLLAPGDNAGYDNSRNTFFLASDDGSWRLNIGGYVQFRYYLNWRDDNGGEEDFESGFQTRRTKIIFDGNVATNVFYKIQGNFNRDSGAFVLEDAYGGYRWDNGLYMKFGQFKLPFMREELVSSAMQLTADRSLTNEIFNQDRSQGIELGYEQEDWRAMVAFSDGFRSRNSDVGANSAFSALDGFTNGGGESDWAITGRFEYKFAGAWNAFKDFTSFPGSDFAALLGVAGHVEQSDQNLTAVIGGNDVQGETTLAGWTADLSLEGDGWNFFVAANGHHLNNNLAITATGASADSSADDYGIVVQGGVFIPNTDWEIFGRYDVSFADADRTTTPAQDDDFSTVTIGTNWYWSGHAAKFTFDVQWFLDDGMVLSGPNTGIGYFQDLSDENEVTLRFQFQFLF
jgi:hypothetical protein